MQYHCFYHAVLKGWRIVVSCIHTHDKLQVFSMLWAAWLLMAILADATYARIPRPEIEELVKSADLIVVGKVESVQATPAKLWQQIGVIVLAGIAIIGVCVLLWKKRILVAILLAIIYLLLFLQIDVPYGIYQRTAHLSVKTTIKGIPSSDNISIYYDDGFVCDVTHLDSGQEYLLFLTKLPAGYTVSWYDWSVWNIKTEHAQTERGAWAHAAPIPLNEFIPRIEKLCTNETAHPAEGEK